MARLSFLLRSLSFLVLSLFLSGCGIQGIPQAKNNVEASLAEVTNQYKRRADLIPNLVNVVKGYAKHEKETLTSVVEARAKASSVTLDPTKINADTLKQYQAAQGQLQTALGKLMVVVEKYPDLKADRNFQELQAQLEGTENRITVARNRYIDSIRIYNDNVTVPPTSWTNSLFYHFDKLPQWSVDDVKAVESAPKVDM